MPWALLDQAKKRFFPGLSSKKCKLILLKTRNYKGEKTGNLKFEGLGFLVADQASTLRAVLLHKRSAHVLWLIPNMGLIWAEPCQKKLSTGKPERFGGFFKKYRSADDPKIDLVAVLLAPNRAGDISHFLAGTKRKKKYVNYQPKFLVHQGL